MAGVYCIGINGTVVSARRRLYRDAVLGPGGSSLTALWLPRQITGAANEKLPHRDQGSAGGLRSDEKN